MFALFKKKAAEDEPLDLVFVPALVVLLCSLHLDAPLFGKEDGRGARISGH
jgi:hypothetical protein